MSARSRGEEPNAVALRSDPGQKSVSASAKIFSSTRILDSAYEVTGRGAPSPTNAPYTEQV